MHTIYKRWSNSKKQTYNNFQYDSGFETEYAKELDLRIKANDILSYDKQVTLDLIVNGYIVCTYRIDFITETGARISEALRFKGKDIIDNEIVLYTRKSKNYNLVPRKLPQPMLLKDIVFKADEKLIGVWKEQPKFLERKVRQLKQKPWGIHNLRHRYASLLLKQGVPFYEIMS